MHETMNLKNIYDTVSSFAGTRLHVLPSVMNDLLKEVEQIFKQHGDCEQSFFVYQEYRFYSIDTVWL
jgi:predicted esterase YcpF (UPF0227 family)